MRTMTALTIILISHIINPIRIEHKRYLIPKEFPDLLSMRNTYTQLTNKPLNTFVIFLHRKYDTFTTYIRFICPHIQDQLRYLFKKAQIQEYI